MRINWLGLLALCTLAASKDILAPSREGCISGRDIRWSTLVEDPQYFPYGIPCYAKKRTELPPLTRRKS